MIVEEIEFKAMYGILLEDWLRWSNEEVGMYLLYKDIEMLKYMYSLNK
jgi:hypothetical protein